MRQPENDSCLLEYKQMLEQPRPQSGTREVRLSAKLAKTSGNRSSHNLNFIQKIPDYTSNSRVSSQTYYPTNNSNNVMINSSD